MPSGPGYWLDPKSDALHRVSTHNDWLLIAENQQAIGLSPLQIAVLGGFDPAREIDEIRMIGVMHGLIRIREYDSRNDQRVSVQFYGEPSHVNDYLRIICDVLPRVASQSNPNLTIQNLFDDAVARLTFDKLVRKLQAGEPILASAGPIEANQALRAKVLFRLNMPASL
jgi:hypothetical protein